MKKSDLYAYVSKITHDKIANLNKRTYELDEVVRKAIETEMVLRFGRVMDNLVAGSKALDKSFYELPETIRSSYYVENSVRGVNDSLALTQNITDAYMGVARTYLSNGSVTEYKMLDELSKRVTRVIDEIDPEFRKLKRQKYQVGTLKKELTAIIRSNTTAKNAFEKLVELGVDMGDFEVKTSKLPVVQKLSVDVGLLK